MTEIAKATSGGADSALAAALSTSRQADTAAAGERHAPGHQITLDCPLPCIGVETIRDLVRVMTDSATRLAIGTTSVHVCHQVAATCSLTCLKMPNRVVNALDKHRPDVRTVADLMALLRDQEFQEIPGIGEDSVSRTKRSLVDAGFSKEQHPYLKQRSEGR